MTSNLDNTATAPKKIRQRRSAPAADVATAATAAPASVISTDDTTSAVETTAVNGPPAAPGPRWTKRDQLVALLRCAGADIAAISATFGWQAHSSRAALTGLRKAGFTLEKTAPEGGGSAIYRIAAEPTNAKAAAR